MPATESRNAVAQLVDDYSGWLQFVVASRCTFRHYEHHLTHLARFHPDLDGHCEFLRDCMHRRSEFFSALQLQLRNKVTQLRTNPTPALILQLTAAQPTMGLLVARLTDSVADIQACYSTLTPFLLPANRQVWGSTCTNHAHVIGEPTCSWINFRSFSRVAEQVNLSPLVCWPSLN